MVNINSLKFLHEQILSVITSNVVVIWIINIKINLKVYDNPENSVLIKLR